jgi:peroxiredoxin
MNMRKAGGIIGGVLFVIGSVAINYQVKIAMHHERAGSVKEMGHIKVGEPAPDFSLNDLSNRPVTLASFRGEKVVLLDFWATWCGPCRMAMPGLQELQEKFKGRSLEILSLNQGEPADQVRPFIERKKYSFHVLLDSAGEVGEKYGVRGIPALVLVDKKGAVQWIRVGYSPEEDDLKAIIERLTE